LIAQGRPQFGRIDFAGHADDFDVDRLCQFNRLLPLPFTQPPVEHHERRGMVTDHL
jgi:hypothetical protein